MDGGTRVFVWNAALRVASAEDSRHLYWGEPVDPARVCFRCQPRLEAAGKTWHWLSRSQFVGTGRRTPDSVFLSFCRAG